MKNLKQIAKRGMALLIVLMMCFSLLPTTAFADNTPVTSAPTQGGLVMDVGGTASHISYPGLTFSCSCGKVLKIAHMSSNGYGDMYGDYDRNIAAYVSQGYYNFASSEDAILTTLRGIKGGTTTFKLTGSVHIYSTGTVRCSCGRQWGTDANGWYSYADSWSVKVYDTFTMTFNANGGKFADGTATKTETVREAVGSKTFTAPTPTREGYTFKDWDGSLTINSTAGNDTKTVNAVWEKKAEEKAPEAPQASELDSIFGRRNPFVTVQCASKDADGNRLHEYDAVSYGLWGDYSAVSIGPVVKGADGTYTCVVTIDGAAYVKHYGDTEPIMGAGKPHTLKTGEQQYKTLTLTWDAANKKWVGTGSVTFQAVCVTPAPYTVVHEYYTNSVFDGSTSSTVNGKNVGDKVNAADITKVLTYNDNTYEYTSTTPSLPYTLVDGTNTITVKYDRTVCTHTGDTSYNDNGDGTHTGTCADCGDTVVDNENHVDEDGDGYCDKDGACVHTHTAETECGHENCGNDLCKPVHTCQGDDGICDTCGKCLHEHTEATCCGHDSDVCENPLCDGGHDVKYTDNKDGTHDGVCTKCGETVVDDQAHVDADNDEECDICGANLHVHDYKWVDNKDGTHDEKCEGCDDVRVDNEKHADGDNNGECDKCPAKKVPYSIYIGYGRFDVNGNFVNEAPNPPSETVTFKGVDGGWAGQTITALDIWNSFIKANRTRVCSTNGLSYDYYYIDSVGGQMWNNDWNMGYTLKDTKYATSNQVCCVNYFHFDADADNDGICDVSGECLHTHTELTECGHNSDECGNPLCKVHEHDYEWTDNGDGTHSNKCECGDVDGNPEDHTYEDGKCTVCGAECKHTNVTYEDEGSFCHDRVCADCGEVVKADIRHYFGSSSVCTYCGRVQASVYRYYYDRENGQDKYVWSTWNGSQFLGHVEDTVTGADVLAKVNPYELTEQADGTYKRSGDNRTYVFDSSDPATMTFEQGGTYNITLKFVHTHVDNEPAKDGKCDECGKNCCEHAEYEWVDNKDGTHDEVCKLCGDVRTDNEKHVDVNTDEVCDKCEADLHVHNYVYADNGDGTHTGTCKCGDTVDVNEEHADGDDDDELCDKCKADLHEHSDGDDDGKCDKDGECMHTHDADEHCDHTDCGNPDCKGPDCVDENGDEECDICGADLHEHDYKWTENDDGTHTGTCDCGDTVTEDHVDENDDDECDICGADLSVNQGGNEPNVPQPDPNEVEIEDEQVPLAGLITRADIIGYLWEQAGSPEWELSDFEDVPEDHQWAVAIGWAQEMGIAVADKDGNFRPDDLILRSVADLELNPEGELEQFLNRYAEYAGIELDEDELFIALEGEVDDIIMGEEAQAILDDFFLRLELALAKAA